MNISYRRRPPISLLERALARLVARQPLPAVASTRLDLVPDVDLELRQA